MIKSWKCSACLKRDILQPLSACPDFSSSLLLLLKKKVTARLINNRDSKQTVFCANNTNRIVCTKILNSSKTFISFRLIFSPPLCIVPRRFCALGMRILKSGQSSNRHETFLNLNAIVRTRITRYSDISIFLFARVRKKTSNLRYSDDDRQ